MKFATREEQKAKALELMKQLDIYQPYIKGFKDKDQVCFYERFAGFWVDQEPEVYNKMKELEKEHGFTVYAITHEYLAFGECWSFLFVSKYKEDWDCTVVKAQGRNYYAFAYVWKKDEEWCSEMGDILVRSFGGGLTRIG